MVIGAVKQLSPADAETVEYTNWLTRWIDTQHQMSRLDHLQSLAVVYGLFPTLRPWLDGIAKSGGRRLCPDGADPLDFALSVLAGPKWPRFVEWFQAHRERFWFEPNRSP